MMKNTKQLHDEIRNIRQAMIFNKNSEDFSLEKEESLKKELVKLRSLVNNNNKSEGLGDTVKKVTEKLGIKQCGGCKRRQEKLNRLFPYQKDSKKEE